ncbi:MAG: hypothetical protein HC896_14050 [Bacteroidales bacterium]|nr:hypothetical protein [Bacteroidales bacterium]
MTSAGLVRLNKWNCDMQFLGGVLNSNDLALGAGWSGYVKKMSFRGELGYFRDLRHFNDTAGVLIASVGSDWSFGNAGLILTEFLYANQVQPVALNFTSTSGNLSVKSMAFAKYSWLVQASYPVAPLLNANLSGMLFSQPNGFFVSPSINLSLSNNASMAVIVQSFVGKFNPQNNAYTQIYLGYLQFKVNF